MAYSVIDGKLFTTCGYNDLGLDTIFIKSTVNVYDPVTDTWDTTRTPIPFPRNMNVHGQSVVDGKWYIVGGFEFERYRDRWMMIPIARVDAYDPETDRWERKANLPEPKGGSGVCALDGKIYVSGGYSGPTDADGQGFYYKSVYMYDPDTDTWTIKADMNFARACHTTIAYDGRIYALGGDDNIIWISPSRWVTKPGRSCEVYDPKLDRWTPISPLPMSINGLRDAAGCVVDNEIYLFGGNDYWSSSYIGQSNIIKYNPENDQWSWYGMMPESNYQHSIFATGRKICVVGGRRGGWQASGSVEEFELGDVELDELIPDTSVNRGDSIIIDLSQHFSHLNGEPIFYTVCFSLDDYASGSCNGTQLTLRGLKEGSLYASILAESGDDQMGDIFQVKVAEATGIDGKNAFSDMFQIFPNPADKRITIQTQKEGTYEYTIYTPNGLKLLEGDLTGQANSIDISALEKGLHFIKVSSPEFSSTKKFVKLK
jgi:N-acetylneuraminic acid mutarotase